jgi:hypothetical protein
MLVGIGFGETLAITTPTDLQCHSACVSCTKPFSANFCSSCSAGYTDESGVCVQNSRAEPPNGFIDYATHDFTAPFVAPIIDNTNSGQGNTEAEGTSIWLWVAIAIVLISLVVFGVVCFKGKKNKPSSEMNKSKKAKISKPKVAVLKVPSLKEFKPTKVPQDEEFPEKSEIEPVMSIPDEAPELSSRTSRAIR